MIIQLIEWTGMALVLMALGAFGSGRMNRGFTLQIMSAIAWTVVGAYASLWGLVALQAGIVYLAVRGLWRYRKNA